ncbi:hypothetical protein ACT4S5_12580 [Kocuria oceani]|uniref:hypothetical protein n=1 Tax=Kocuria oceani TaxID=988827 RepID=UPI0040351D10
MILDLSCTSSTRGPTVRTAHRLLGGLLLAGLLAGCGAADAEGRSTPETGGGSSAAATPSDGQSGEKDGEKDGEKSGEAAASGEAGEAGGAVALETPLEVHATDLPSSEPVAADAPQVRQITAVFEAQEAFVPAEQPVSENPQVPEQEKPTELDPAAVAAAEKTADGAALQEVLASLTEFQDQGWEQRGVPVVVGEPVSAPLPAEDGEALRVTVCLDSSQVTVVDRDGVVVRGPEKDRRALHNYDLFREPGQSWQVVQHGFPDDPTC